MRWPETAPHFSQKWCTPALLWDIVLHDPPELIQRNALLWNGTMSSIPMHSKRTSGARGDHRRCWAVPAAGWIVAAPLTPAPNTWTILPVPVLTVSIMGPLSHNWVLTWLWHRSWIPDEGSQGPVDCIQFYSSSSSSRCFAPVVFLPIHFCASPMCPAMWLFMPVDKQQHAGSFET